MIAAVSAGAMQNAEFWGWCGLASIGAVVVLDFVGRIASRYFRR